MNDDGAMLGRCLVRRIERFWHAVIHTEPFQHVVGIFVSLSLPRYGGDMLADC